MWSSKEFWSKYGMPAPDKEFKFCASRKFRIDYSWIDVKLALEIEGGAWIGGRHTRGKGFINDMVKYNLLTEMGWCLLRYIPNKVDYDQISRVYHNLKSGGL